MDKAELGILLWGGHGVTGSQNREPGMGGLSLLPKRDTLIIPSFNHLDFNLFNNIITEHFPCAWPWVGWWHVGVTVTCSLPPEALWVVGR